MCNVNVLLDLIPACNQQSLCCVYFQKIIVFSLNHSIKAFERLKSNFKRKTNKQTRTNIAHLLECKKTQKRMNNRSTPSSCVKYFTV